MKSNEILELVRAGFTKEEIMAMDVSGKHTASEDPKEPEASEDPKEPAASEPDERKVFSRGIAEFMKMLEKEYPINTDPEESSEESSVDNALEQASKKFSDAVKNFEEQMDTLTKKFQDNNILLSSMKSEETLKTGEDIIAELINPPEVESEYAKRLFGGKEK